MDFKELRNLQEAYMDVYEQDEILDEAEVMKHQKERSAIERRKKMKGYEPPTKGVHGEIERRQAQKPPSKLRSGSLPESYDLYDIILSHLIDGGYAETEGAAESIMTNMSEEWREDILSEAIRNPESRKKLRDIEDKEVRKGDKSKGENPRSKYPTEKGKLAGHLLRGPESTGSKGNPVRSRGGTSAPPEERDRSAANRKYWAGNAGPTRDRGAGNKAARRAGTYKESFNIFVNSMIAEGVSMERYTWEEIQNVFDDLFEAQVANRNPDEYERKAKQGQSREQQLKGKVMGRMSQMDPDKKAAMLKQMRAVGLDV